ncbi:hypothetical protein T492DRAFT_901300 [Pavlovales sp. CCMP2436]|nr:hypothetical protein T492DRAFT_901300 [Pavlovales sp. CCMP2436]
MARARTDIGWRCGAPALKMGRVARMMDHPGVAVEGQLRTGLSSQLKRRGASPGGRQTASGRVPNGLRPGARARRRWRWDSWRLRHGDAAVSATQRRQAGAVDRQPWARQIALLREALSRLGTVGQLWAVLRFIEATWARGQPPSNPQPILPSTTQATPIPRRALINVQSMMKIKNLKFL